MKVTVIDCSVSGHRETYYKQFAHTWAGMGNETSLIAPDGKGIQEAVACCRFLPGNRCRRSWLYCVMQ